MMTRWLMVLMMTAFSGCLQGCIVPVSSSSKLFGDKAPKITVEKTCWFFGLFCVAKAEAGGDFAGDADVGFKPETGEFHVKAQVKNNPSPVIVDNADLIRSMEATRAMDYASRTVVQGQVNEQLANVNSIIQTLGSRAPDVMPMLFPNGVGGPQGPATSPVDRMLAIWESLPDDMKGKVMAKMTGGVFAPAGP